MEIELNQSISNKKVGEEFQAKRAGKSMMYKNDNQCLVMMTAGCTQEARVRDKAREIAWIVESIYPLLRSLSYVLQRRGVRVVSRICTGRLQFIQCVEIG